MVHVANLFTAIGAGLAYFSTRLAVQRVVFTVAAHEVDASFAGSDTIKHPLDVLLLHMFTSLNKAVTGQLFGAGRLTFLAVLDAFLFAGGCRTHLGRSFGKVV
ncbi:hypothetical protein [Rosistilla oblonga]|uniref:hypothetical protein n=1 Tax=Rosistilla oblonga TaxID=2527990 RepID=UPI003A975A0B